ncbi:MAG: energy-coupling factor transporter ATPase [Clostridiales Family XIII bacterium]|jgi:energy-coupling factor transport system ATP-binding protein|nr:energy-coupling factor transporter ATPase [Clostridiales Family XIII bacterium]
MPNEKNDNENIIDIEDLTFAYRRGSDGFSGDTEREQEQIREHGQEDIQLAVDHVTLKIRRGSFTSVIGRNGSGKSTLAKNVNALLLPGGGRVIVDGYDTKDEAVLWEIRRRVGMVFQNPDNQLVSAVVEDDVAFGPENLGIEPDEIRKRIRTALESVDMYEHRKMSPHLLSGGQKQRIAIAGVVAMHPEIIIFDEPTAMLDPEGRGEVMAIIRKLHSEGVTVVLITHFMGETLDADRLVIMEKGRVVLDGTPAEVFSHANEIEEYGLKLPFAVDVAKQLRELGIDIPGSVLTQEALALHIADVIAKDRTLLRAPGEVS